MECKGEISECFLHFFKQNLRQNWASGGTRCCSWILFGSNKSVLAVSSWRLMALIQIGIGWRLAIVAILTRSTGGVLHKCFQAVNREVAGSRNIGEGCFVFGPPVIPGSTSLEREETGHDKRTWSSWAFKVISTPVMWACNSQCQLAG